MASPSHEALIGMVLDDPLVAAAHPQVRALRGLLRNKSDLIPRRLRSIRDGLLPGLPFTPPDRDYSRFTPVGTFWAMVANSECQQQHASIRGYWAAKGYQQGVAHAPALDDLEPMAAPDPHSWLVSTAAVPPGLSGRQVKSKLVLESGPPYIRMDFSMGSLLRHGIRLRHPNALDAAVGEHGLWVRGAVPGERVDRDLPSAAIQHVWWIQ